MDQSERIQAQPGLGEMLIQVPPLSQQGPMFGTEGPAAGQMQRLQADPLVVQLRGHGLPGLGHQAGHLAGGEGLELSEHPGQEVLEPLGAGLHGRGPQQPGQSPFGSPQQILMGMARGMQAPVNGQVNPNVLQMPQASPAGPLVGGNNQLAMARALMAQGGR